MSGERVSIIKERACAFLELARELVGRDRLDIASFNVHQACQLRIKATMLRLFGEIPRIHSIRELLGVLAKRLEELNYLDESDSIVSLVRENKDSLIDIESAYVESRYGVVTAGRRAVKAIAKAVKDLDLRVDIYVIGGAAEDRLTILSDIDVLVCLDVSEAEDIGGLRKRILIKAMDEHGLPWDYPIELYILPRGECREALRHIGKFVKAS